MKRITGKWTWLFVSLLICSVMTTPALADQYPGVYSGDNSLIFIQSADESGGLQGIVVLSYEYSMDWIITTGGNGMKNDTGIIVTDGNRYVYNADGTRRSEMEFTSLEIDIDWDTMDFSVLPSYGFYLAPMVHGGLAYALVETRSGLPSQLVLAREVFESEDRINLYEGFLYQLSDGKLTAQIAFTEMAFGSQGLMRGNFPDDFPPPPEDYPIPYPDYSTPGYQPPPSGYNPQNPTADTDSQYYYDPTRPPGTIIEAGDNLNRPYFTLEQMHDYDVPPIALIGVVEVQSYGEIEGYGSVCDENLQEMLGGIDGVEVVHIPYDSARLGGAVLYDRAVWLCEEYGVDALLISELNKLSMPGVIGTISTTRTVRVNSEIRSELIDGVGGTKIWSGEFESNQIHDSYEIEGGVEEVIEYDLFHLVKDLVADIVTVEVLNGIHID